MKDVTLGGLLDTLNDVRYTLRTDITVQIGEDPQGYPQASYAPLGLKAEDLTEAKAVDSLKRKIVIMYENLVTNQGHAVDSKSRSNREHLLRLIERNAYDPRESLETAASK